MPSRTARLPPAARHRTVVIADGSVVVQGLFARWLGDSGQFHVAAVAGDAETALAHTARHRPDILVFDLGMGGGCPTTVLPQILERSPHTSILLAATLNEHTTRLALECMTKGALDLVAKPDSRKGLPLTLDFRSEFLLKLDGIAEAHPSVPKRRLAETAPGPVNLRHIVSTLPRYLVIGASTGGPRAVAKVLQDMGDSLPFVTTAIVQHMPPLFTASFAEQMAAETGCPAREPHDGERLAPGTIYIAPGGRHLGIDRRLGHIVARVSDDPPVRFCRPAVDVLFADAARHLGPAALGLVLTGMGSDGTEGASALRQAGAAVIAQDEFSSTIWGMPGSVVRARLASAVLPLDQIGGALSHLFAGERRA